MSKEDTDKKRENVDDNNSTSTQENKGNWSSMLAFMGIFIIIFLSIIIWKQGLPISNEGALTGNSIANYNGDIQTAKMYVEGIEYKISPSTFKVGVPVRIEADIARMPGCSKSIQIPGMNIKKSLTSKDNVIEFTPTRAGTFYITCSMNMYRGTFTVLQEDGTKSDYAESAPAGGHTCGGAGGGGCGSCGG